MDTASAFSPAPLLSEEERLRRYGYRLVPKTLADGSHDYEYLALTLEDLFHPQMGEPQIGEMETEFEAMREEMQRLRGARP